MKELYSLSILLTVWPIGQTIRSDFTTSHDARRLIDQTTIILPAPVILLTREDAVAHELLTKSRTMMPEQALRVAQTICKLSCRLNKNPLLFIALIRVESNFNHLAASPVGAEGLMQVMPYTAKWTARKIGLEWPDGHSFDPVLNVQLGIHYLIFMYEEFDSHMDHALTAYNRGPDATHYILDNNEGKLPPKIHEFYSAKVFRHYKDLQQKYGHLPAY